VPEEAHAEANRATVQLCRAVAGDFHILALAAANRDLEALRAGRASRC
jgi:hypothetical protein